MATTVIFCFLIVKRRHCALRWKCSKFLSLNNILSSSAPIEYNGHWPTLVRFLRHRTRQLQTDRRRPLPTYLVATIDGLSWAEIMKYDCGFALVTMLIYSIQTVSTSTGFIVPCICSSRTPNHLTQDPRNRRLRRIPCVPENQKTELSLINDQHVTLETLLQPTWLHSLP
jgi:hypothetical protein